MSLANLLRFWQTDQAIRANIKIWREFPPRAIGTLPFPDDLHQTLARGLETLGIRALFSHQAEAWQLIQSQKNVVLVTGTASGKTLGYTLPVMDHLLRNPDARALYLFPTKALAQDQLNMLDRLVSALPAVDRIPRGIYDGDTPANARKAIRQNSRILITNPDMLHIGILPHHTTWVDFFRNLSFIVIDEIHAYRGIFGSHVANVLRRLGRILRFYGSDPRFFLTSATIANPVRFAEKLTGLPINLVERDGSSRGRQNFLIYNPPIINPELGIRRSALSESMRLASDLLAYDVQSILFTGSRRSVELAVTGLRRENIVDQKAIQGYRSGYLPAERREIEAGLRDGRVKLVAATNALELGIDIGHLDAALLAGFPGTIASTWQQAGRAGRGEKGSLAVLVATGDPLDQFLVSHPDYFFSRSPEEALINPDNLLILFHHLRSALFELPFEPDEGFGPYSGEQMRELLELIQQSGEAHRSNGKYFWVADHYPANNISLRSASANRVLLQAGESGRPLIIGEVDFESAHWMVHPGAVYLHQGQSYLVDELDLEHLTASLHPAELDFYTQPRRDSSVETIAEAQSDPIPGGVKFFGEILVTSQVVGYQKIHWETQEPLDVVSLEMPSTQLQTTGCWVALDEMTVDRLREQGLWSNDPNQYGPGWNNQRNLARARDGYRCQNCGKPEQGIAHHVHHKIPFKAFSSPEQANRLANLVTLCPACHQRAETVVRMRSGLSGLSYTIGHLAPLFLMCDPRDLGRHSDPQSPLAGGQPAVVVYDQVPAGIGLSQRLYEIYEQVIRSAIELVTRCPCEDGCPSCVGPPGELGVGGKGETLAVLDALSGNGNHLTPPEARTSL